MTLSFTCSKHPIRARTIIGLAIVSFLVPFSAQAQSIQGVKVTSKSGPEPHTVIFDLQITGEDFGTDVHRVTVIVTPRTSIYKPTPEVGRISSDGTRIEASFEAPEGYAPRTVTVSIKPSGVELKAEGASTSDPFVLSGDGSTSGRLKDIKVYRSIIDPKVVGDIFGQRIAHRFVVMQVTITNRNKDYQFLIHDVSVDLSKVIPESDLGKHREVSSIELSLLRGVAERGQQSDPRNLILRVLRGSGTIAAGLIGVTDFGASYPSAVAAFNGPVVSAYAEGFPDHTINQMNRLNDSAYLANSVVPKEQAKVVAIFMPQAIFLNPKQQHAFWKDPTSLWEHTCPPSTDAGASQRRTQAATGSFASTATSAMTAPKNCVEPMDLRQLEIAVDGNFITEVDGLVPSLTAVAIPVDELKKFQHDKPIVKGYISGHYLTDATLKLLNTTDLKGMTIELDGVPSDDKMSFTLKSDGPITPGQILKIGVVKKDSTKEIDYTVQYPAAAPTITEISSDALKQGDSDKSVTVTGTNFLANVTTVLIDPAGGITVGAVNVKSSTELDVKLTVSNDANAAERKVFVETPGGRSSGFVKLTINQSTASGAPLSTTTAKTPQPSGAAPKPNNYNKPGSKKTH